MDKKSFVNVLNQYPKGSVTEALDIIALKHLYPYCQILHVLSARLSKDHGFSTQQEELQSAAVYSSDRAVLKGVMTNTSVALASESNINQSVTAQKEIVQSIQTDVTPIAIIPVDNSTVDNKADNKIISYISNGDVADELANDLQLLTVSRQNFELMFNEMSLKKVTEDQEPKAKVNDNKAFVAVKEIENEKVEKNSIEKDKIEKEKAEKSGKSKKARIIEIAKALEESRSHIEKTHIPSKKKKDSGDGLIEEIASTKKEIDPETEKQKAQIEIIDSFIKAQPTIVNTKDKVLPVPSGDLSTIKSGEFGDNIVSETLVDILIKQGKKDKAIEVLKKLIWKFPQKKAYFATQIEELKK